MNKTVTLDKALQSYYDAIPKSKPQLTIKSYKDEIEFNLSRPKDLNYDRFVYEVEYNEIEGKDYILHLDELIISRFKQKEILTKAEVYILMEAIENKKLRQQIEDDAGEDL